ncbi:hypothetical protein ACFOSW_01865 [Paenibacillus sp. GCM10012303]
MRLDVKNGAGERIEGDKRYSFRLDDTDIVLGADKGKHGLVSCRVPGIGYDLVREPYYVLNLYRIMNEGRLRAIARNEPFVVSEETASGIRLQWEPTEANPCRMEAVYTIADASTIDLSITIEAVKPLSGHELTISSYFDFLLEPYAVLPNWPGKKDDSDLHLLKVEDHPYIKGHYVYFPRDNEAAHTHLDGRWLDEKSGKPIAHFVTGPYYGRPIAVMGNEDVHVVQMADPAECGAIGITYSSPEENDSIRRHNALYFTLFGGQLQAGDRREARMRQVILSGKPSLDRLLELYKQFV